MSTYESIEDEYNIHANKLVQIAKETSEGTIEGNVFTHHLSFDLYFPGLKRRKNIYTASLGHKFILEIGFNAGHSCLVMLLSNPESVVYAFDICEHLYVKPCLEYLHSVFGTHRIILYEGNSLDIIPITILPNKPTLFHIDGSHLYEFAAKDLENCYNIAEDGDVFILDDTNIIYLEHLWSSYINANKLVQFKDERLIGFENTDCRHQIGIVRK